MGIRRAMEIIIMDALLVLLLLGGVIGAFGFVVMVTALSPRRLQFSCQPLQASQVPYRRRTFLFSAAERAFYKGLRTLFPDHMIFVKVRLADLVSIKLTRPSIWEHFSPINRKLIDFVVCDPTLAPVLAIELGDAKSSLNPTSPDTAVNSMLAKAALPLLRIPEKRQYLFSELRQLLHPYLRVPRPLL